MSDLTQMFASMDGAEIPGGCDSCDAVQVPSVRDGFILLTIKHDEQCPVLNEQRKAELT